MKITDPSFGDINRLIVEQVSSFTHARRFGGGTGFKNFRELDTKLICYPNFRILTTARSFTSETSLEKSALIDLTKAAFEDESCMVKLKSTNHKKFSDPRIPIPYLQYFSSSVVYEQHHPPVAGQQQIC